MFVARLLAAGTLAYAALRLRKYLSQGNVPTQCQAEDVKPVEDILMEDPVCQRLIPREQAFILHHIDATYYFCSKNCQHIFQQQSEESA